MAPKAGFQESGKAGMLIYMRQVRRESTISTALKFGYTALTRKPEWEKGSQIETCEPLSLLVAGARFDRCLTSPIRLTGLR